METKLYIPPPVSAPVVEPPRPAPRSPVANPPLATVLSPAESLRKVRQETCYQALRSLVNILQFLCFVGAGFIVSLAILGGSTGAAAGIMGAAMGVAWALILVILGIAGKQAALLLVDIADCQIRLAGTGYSPRAGQ